MSEGHTHQPTHDKTERKNTSAPTSQPGSAGSEFAPLRLDQTNVVGLQRTVGNKNVQRLIADGRLAAGPQPKSDSDSHLPPVPGAVQRAPKRGDQAANIDKLTGMKTKADSRFKTTNDYSTRSLEVGDLTRDKLVALSNTYKEAYGVFRGVLDKAEQEAQNQQDWTNIIVGVACGVAAGLLAAWVLPASAGAAFTITLSEAAIAGASSIVQGGAAAAASAGLSNLTNVEGKKLDSKGLDPTLMDLAIWQKAADIYRSGLEFSQLGGALHTLTVNLSDFIGDVRVYNTGGKSDLTDAKINEKITALEGKESEVAKHFEEVATKYVELENIKQTVSGIDPAAHSVRKMEKDIWILWMSGLAVNSNILDLDAIEDHIGPKGLGIVDFGIYTSDADENEAIENARNNAAQMRAENSATDVPGDKGGQLRILTR